MTKDLVKILLCLLAISIAQTLCDVESIVKLEEEFDSLMNTARSRVNELKGLQTRANVALYAKLNRYIGETMQSVVDRDLTRVRTLIGNRSSTNSDICYVKSYRKIKRMGRKAFAEMKPCIKVATETINDYLANFASTLQIAGNMTENLTTLRVSCSSSENLDKCVNQAYPEGKTSVAFLEETILNSETNIQEAGEKVLESATECFDEIFNSTRTKTHEVVEEVQNCLKPDSTSE